jgi:hypothetical protein
MVADALRAPSIEPDDTTTIWSATPSTPYIAECIRPVPQSVSTML